ncbi:helix-turn-helix transcriptional regulator [Streptomyces alkaliterrae]|uniref:HTH domain-containing protein n=1 Tax=Streptomyces alkaliterrae TaxID=2213162 RepID=A0A5P0YVJ0_9ACTN|nr:helix-turn-helix transcriptional regulator [Streptomyces alkaliterrae]MBB1262219.1 helix-turn-helix transcriptional regulator [Streptomyces alkaliterrae]MQS04301.1 HTH domain-containing protein [Streptomyces alkaliterrae]
MSRPARPPGGGLTPETEALYRELLSGAVVNAADAAADAAPEECVRRLVELGLVRVEADGRVRPLSPRLALESWAAERELEALRARESADRLAGLFAERTGSGARFAEVLDTAEDVVRTFGAMQDGAQRSIRGFERGSILKPDDIGPNEWQVAGMRRGVRYHIVYESEYLQTEVGLRSLRSSVRAGEVARVFPGVPMKLAIADADRALISVPGREGNGVMALLVHPSMLLDAIIELFEAFWRLAVPVGAAGAGGASGGRDAGTVASEPTPETQRLLALLSAGSTDEAIARDLKVSERTVHRRISRLQELLGARTRFQLGVQAARRGWL